MHPAHYRIEDLAQHSGATVRTIRGYQDRGLLPKPERRGRANVYDDSHLARLQQISGLLARGYTLSSIKELLNAWDSGVGLGGVLGLVTEVDRPWSDEVPGVITRSELTAIFGDRGEGGTASGSGYVSASLCPPDQGGQGNQGNQGNQGENTLRPTETAAEARSDTDRDTEIRASIGTDDGASPDASSGSGVFAGAGTRPEGTSLPARPTVDDQALAEAVELGVLVPVEGDSERYHVPSPQELAVAAELHRAGASLGAVTAHLRELRGQIEHIADRFLDFTTEHVFARYLDHTPTPEEVSEATALIRRLRPLAQQTVDAELARAMGELSARHLQQHMSALTVASPPAEAASPAPSSRADTSRSCDGQDASTTYPTAGDSVEPTRAVPLPVGTVRAVCELVGERAGESTERVTAFVAAATQREVHARTMDRLTRPQPSTDS